MKKQVFYSWQSDLPNSTNRGFIENCLKHATKELSKQFPYEIEFNLDRDTKNEIGTPDIVDTIFKKIERSSVFVADISLINPKSKERKFPNPNVLIELGYAAKTLGWERIICLYNLDFGMIEELPFDLRFRRPLTYRLTGQDKPTAKSNLSKELQYALLEINQANSIHGEIQDYVKVKVDIQILSLLKILMKIVDGYPADSSKLEKFSTFINLNEDDLYKKLSTQKYIGFQIFKNFDELRGLFEKLLEHPLVIGQLSKSQIAPLVKYLQALISYENIQSVRHVPDIYVPLNKVSTEFKVVRGSDINPSNDPNSFLLMRPVTGGSYQVVDFGTFTEKQKIDALLTQFRINPKHLRMYQNEIRRFITITNEWLEQTGDEFILDDKVFKFTQQMK